ncbi:MAG: type IV toxin-antitoxin system AbiEi family antitoxin domain-containing protein [Solirubrobacteraceae bacterium]
MAREQHGLVTVAQLVACGLTKPAISRRVKAGRLHWIHRGVYALGRPDLSQAGVFHAALLAIGDDAILNHRAGAAMWGFWDRRIDRVEITVARRVASRDGIRVYQVADIPRADWRWCEGMRVATPERVALDLAVSLRSEASFRRTIHEALVQRRVSQASLQHAIEAHPGHKGVKRLAAEVKDGAKPTRSTLEDWGVDLLRRRHFPAFKTNVHIRGTPAWVEVDIYFPDHGLVIELDGDRYHDTPYRRERDATKQQLIEAVGLKFLRLTDEDAEPANEARTVKRINEALT